MIRTHALPAPQPDALTLDPDGRTFMMAWLNVSVLIQGGPTPEQWREAYGHAADYQTAEAGRRLMARESMRGAA